MEITEASVVIRKSRFIHCNIVVRFWYGVVGPPVATALLIALSDVMSFTTVLMPRTSADNGPVYAQWVQEENEQ